MIATWLTLLGGLVAIAVIIAANGYFVAQEFAYMSVDRQALRARAAAGDKQAERALKVTGRTSFMLSGAQLGITVTGLLVGYVAEPLVGSSIGELLGLAGSAAWITAVVLAGSTIIQMVFGELFPKNLAIANPTPLARTLAASTLAYLKVFGWLITFFDKSANAFLRLLKVEPVHDIDSSATAEDLEQIIDDSMESGDLPKELSLLLDRILDFPEQDVERAMIPRSLTDTVEPETSLREMRVLMAQGHTRYPVIADREEPVGVVHMADVLPCASDDDRPVTEVMRKPLVVPTTMPLQSVLEELFETKNELACVIDEWGGFVGVLTVEDLAEELIGEITDEHDPPEEDDVTPDGEDAWVIEGDVHLDEVERELGRDLPRGDYETVSGLLIDVLERLPEEGEQVRIDLPVEGSDLVEDEPVRYYLQVDILEIDRHVPAKVRVEMLEEPLEEEPEDDEPHDGAAHPGEESSPGNGESEAEEPGSEENSDAQDADREEER